MENKTVRINLSVEVEDAELLKDAKIALNSLTNHIEYLVDMDYLNNYGASVYGVEVVKEDKNPIFHISMNIEAPADTYNELYEDCLGRLSHHAGYLMFLDELYSDYSCSIYDVTVTEQK